MRICAGARCLYRARAGRKSVCSRRRILSIRIRMIPRECLSHRCSPGVHLQESASLAGTGDRLQPLSRRSGLSRIDTGFAWPDTIPLQCVRIVNVHPRAQREIRRSCLQDHCEVKRVRFRYDRKFNLRAQPIRYSFTGSWHAERRCGREPGGGGHEDGQDSRSVVPCLPAVPMQRGTGPTRRRLDDARGHWTAVRALWPS